MGFISGVSLESNPHTLYLPPKERYVAMTGDLKMRRSSATNSVSMAPLRPYEAHSSALRRRANRSGWTTWGARGQKCICPSVATVALEIMTATTTKTLASSVKVCNLTELTFEG